MESENTFDIFLVAPPGLENVIADEARERGFAGVTQLYRSRVEIRLLTADWVMRSSVLASIIVPVLARVSKVSRFSIMGINHSRIA